MGLGFAGGQDEKTTGCGGEIGKRKFEEVQQSR